jgi:hypothetical protein
LKLTTNLSFAKLGWAYGIYFLYPCPIFWLTFTKNITYYYPLPRPISIQIVGAASEGVFESLIDTAFLNLKPSIFTKTLPLSVTALHLFYARMGGDFLPFHRKWQA